MAETVIVNVQQPTGQLHKLLVPLVHLAKFVNFGTHDDTPQPDHDPTGDDDDDNVTVDHDPTDDDPFDYDDAGTDNDHEYPTTPEFT
jgi:hypothetical protein